MSLTTAIPAVISHYGYWAVFGMVAMESLGIPLPGETVLISAAIASAALHDMNIVLVIAAAVVGASLGDNIGYWVGRNYGAQLLAKHGQKIGLGERQLKLGHFLFQKHGAKIVFFGRFVAFLRTFAALLAGANHYDARRFMVFNVMGAILWATTVGLLGYGFGAAAERLAKPFSLTLAVLTVAALIWLWPIYKRQEGALMQEAEAMAAREEQAQEEQGSGKPKAS